jgi:two-component system OmpR family response regulator
MSCVLPHVLAVDDEPDMRTIIMQYLGQHELRVTTVASGPEMDQAMQREIFDCLVLDLKLPGEDGLTIARRLREQSRIPILMVTGRADEVDRVIGLELGADDYLTKPFSPRELLARIRALLRRVKLHSTIADEVGKLRAYRFEGWELNVKLRRLKSPDGKVQALPNGEFSLLTALLSSPQRVLTRSHLIEQSHVYDDEVYDRSIDVQILRLRRKIEQNPAQPRYIVTERGAGYMMAVPVEAI